MKLLQSNPFNTDQESQDLLLKHFGRFFASAPHEFQFMSGDRKLILTLRDHVNDIIAREGYTHFKKNPVDVETCLCEELEYSHSQVLLNRLIDAAKTNSNRSPQGYRYDDVIKQFAVYTRMMAGPLAYQTVQYNLRGAWPSLQSTNRFIQKTNEPVLEGIVRSKELYLYLMERKLSLVVSLSEDATRISGRPQYDRKTNQIVGFTPPISNTSGLPIPLSFPARNVKEICEHFSGDNSESANVNVVVAQPLCNAPSFCLLVYGFDNKHRAVDILNRWKSITTELKSQNIEVLTISTDSDTRKQIKTWL